MATSEAVSYGGAELNQEYLTYIASPQWAARKARFYRTHPRICQACGAIKRIHLHHMTYQRLGHEDDADFATLCGVCHKTVHAAHQQARRMNAGASLWTISRLFISRATTKKARPERVKPRKKRNKYGPDAPRNAFTQRSIQQRRHDKVMSDQLAMVQKQLRVIQSLRRSALGEAPAVQRTTTRVIVSSHSDRVTPGPVRDANIEVP